jgi:alkanesulfonate monooxygenase SsuD/methylene tetrahydromethanopterin reductase-like flavin-dependent oxidoreductase (luciferase family)
MLFGISLPPFGEYADPHKLADIAREAEEAGWDGFFLWDHILFDPSFHPIVDPWIALAAIALNTKRIRLGVLVTGISRRRPWKLARETVSLDHLSNGRMVVGVGLGEPPDWDFSNFGEVADAKLRGQMVDEGLDILNGLWSGEPFRYDGTHYQIKEAIAFRPRPVQTPRIPVWVGGTWDKARPQQRAARWDGYFPLKWQDMLTPEEWRGIMAQVNSLRTNDAPFDWLHTGRTPSDNPTQAAAIVQPLIEVGVTWWIEDIEPWRYGLGWTDQLTPDVFRAMDERIRQGPPRSR